MIPTVKYRITRKSPYNLRTCSGHTDPSARDGHYKTGDLDQALAEIREEYPGELLTVQCWDYGDDHGKVILDETGVPVV